MFQSNILYGLFPLVGEWVRASLSKLNVYALHVVKRECTTHNLMSCTDDGTLQYFVFGTVVVVVVGGRRLPGAS